MQIKPDYAETHQAVIVAWRLATIAEAQQDSRIAVHFLSNFHEYLQLWQLCNCNEIEFDLSLKGVLDLWNGATVSPTQN